METERTGFDTVKEPHPTELCEGGTLNNNEVSIKQLRAAIPSYCFEPSLFWSFFYLFRDLTYSAILLSALWYGLKLPQVQQSNLLYYALVGSYGVAQGIVWTGLWIIAHDAGHSGFSKSPVLNDTVGFILHSFLLAPYFSWKSSHRRHHIYANNLEKDLNYVPPRRNEYARKIGVAIDKIEEVGEDAPVVLFFRIILQQVIGWNWYILSNITTPDTALVKKGLSVWRYSHFDPWGGMFRDSEVASIILSDIGCLGTITGLYYLYQYLGSLELVFWMYIVPWSVVNHFIVMITFLHHTHPDVPKYTADNWTFLRGATATIDRDFGIIGTHFFHHISSDHVTHHLFSSIPHYWSRTASEHIIPLLGSNYHGRAGFTFNDLKTSFRDCQWVEEDAERDKAFGIGGGDGTARTKQALWYRKGISPKPEFHQRKAPLFTTTSTV